MDGKRIVMTSAPISTKHPALVVLGLLAGFTLAVMVRLVIGGHAVAGSASAGLVFAGCLIALGLAAGTRFVISKRAAIIGLLGGLALCVPAVVAHLSGQPPVSVQGYLGWAVAVTIVATAEEFFLRGTLYDAVTNWRGQSVAILVSAVAFALLHVPLYGWQVLPLDLAVGLWLGSLRAVTNTWTAPAMAHTIADLLAWWLR